MANLLPFRRLGIVLAVLAGTVLPSLTVQAAPYSALVLDAANGRVLYEQDADDYRYPASLTKMMTLYLVFEALNRGRLDLRQTLWVSARAASRPPSKLGLKAGDRLTVEEAILGLVTRSANDAATTLAEGLAGSEEGFARLMTQKARALGMTRSSFSNASGLPDPDQVTTARDMARLALALQRHFPQQYRYFSTPYFYFRNRAYDNHNRLLGDYPGTDGIKTGYIRSSGYNLVASAQREGRRVIGVVFGGETASARNEEMRLLLDQGFAQLGVGERSPLLAYNDRGSLPAVIARPQVWSSAPPSAMRDTAPAPIAYGQPSPQLIGRSSAALELSRGGPARPPVSAATPGWQVRIGLFDYVSEAQQQVIQARRLAPDPLQQAQVSILPLYQDGRQIYGAYFRGLSQDEAGTTCRLLRRSQIDCFLLPPPRG